MTHSISTISSIGGTTRSQNNRADKTSKQLRVENQVTRIKMNPVYSPLQKWTVSILSTTRFYDPESFSTQKNSTLAMASKVMKLITANFLLIISGGKILTSVGGIMTASAAKAAMGALFISNPVTLAVVIVGLLLAIGFFCLMENGAFINPKHEMIFNSFLGGGSLVTSIGLLTAGLVSTSFPPLFIILAVSFGIVGLTSTGKAGYAKHRLNNAEKLLNSEKERLDSQKKIELPFASDPKIDTYKSLAKNLNKIPVDQLQLINKVLDYYVDKYKYEGSLLAVLHTALRNTELNKNFKFSSPIEDKIKKYCKKFGKKEEFNNALFQPYGYVLNDLGRHFNTRFITEEALTVEGWNYVHKNISLYNEIFTRAEFKGIVDILGDNQLTEFQKICDLEELFDNVEKRFDLQDRPVQIEDGDPETLPNLVVSPEFLADDDVNIEDNPANHILPYILDNY